MDNNKRFLKQDGVSFRPIGVNYPWPSGKGYPLRNLVDDNQIVYDPEDHGQLPPIAHYEQYLRMMDTLAMNGVNYFRMIMNPFTLDIEYEKLGDYSDRMHIAEEMDLILERAAANDILIHWNLMLHNTLQINGYHIDLWDWTDENSGTGYCYKTQIDSVETPLDFLTNHTAKKYYKERLRYIIARWGYSSDIAMFEHFSEIDQIGTEHDENAEAISFTNQYAGNEAVFNEWHGEMSWYLKEVLEIPQLLTLSYTTEYDEDLDHSFWHGNIDVINLNNYNYNTSDIHGYHRRNIRKKIAETGDDYNDGHHVWGNYKKPLFFSEMGAHEVWNCDNNVETRRSIWQSYFWGISGGLEWHLPADLSIYQRVDDFISGVDLEGGKWHSGMMKLDNQDRWEYKQSYRDDCIRKDELADVVYLRSGDKEKAFGVITNRRANYWTLGDDSCLIENNIPAPVYSDSTSDDYTELTEELQSFGSVSPSSGSNRLRIRNMALGFLGLPKEYKIKYYSPYDQVNSIKEETRWSPKLTLEFPDLENLDIVLFEVFPMGENFKSATNDTTSIDKEITNRSKDELQKQEVLIYPNPNDGKFAILLENPETVKGIYISNNLGQVVDSRNELYKQNSYTLNYFNSGVYSIEVVYSDKTIRKKIIIN